MRKLILRKLALVLLTLASYFSFFVPMKSQACAHLGQLQSNLTSLFAKESAAVVFRFQPPGSDHSVSKERNRYFLVQTDETGNEIHRLGFLLDDGILGDHKPQDGVYGRKFNISQKTGGFRYYQVVEATVDGEKPVSHILRIEVVAHPPIQVLLKRIWDRIRAPGV